MKTIKDFNRQKMYTAEQLIKKYKGKYINTYPKHYDYRDEKTGEYVTLYEVRGVSKTIKENFNLPEDEVN
jgi:hypothetical protein